MAINQNDEQVYLFTGTSEIFIKNRMNRIIQGYDPKETSVIRYDMETTSLSTVLNDLLTIPFLEKQKIIILRRPRFLKNIHQDEKNSVKEFIKYLKNPLDTTILLIDATNMNVSNSNEVYKVLKNTAFIVNYDDSEEIEIKGWIIRTLSLNNIEIKDDALTLFLEYVNGDQSRMEHEIDKLTAYGLSSHIITAEDIKLLVSRDINQEIYNLIKEIIRRDSEKANTIYNKLANNTKDVMAIISLISATFRDLLTTSRLLKKGYSQNDIAKFYGVSSGRAYYIVKDAKAFKLEDLEKNVEKLAELDFKIKSGQIDKNTGIELFLLQM